MTPDDDEVYISQLEERVAALVEALEQISKMTLHRHTLDHARQLAMQAISGGE